MHISTSYDLSGCPSRWTKLDTGCYLFLGEEPRNWMEARDKCQEEGGYLAEVVSKEENAAITEAIIFLGWREKNREPWIGLNNLKAVGQWRWNHSERLLESGSYSYWLQNQPSYIHKDRCVFIGGENRWNNRECEGKTQYWRGRQYSYHAICQM